jgi:pantothenate kinase-related protein Tda10
MPPSISSTPIIRILTTNSDAQDNHFVYDWRQEQERTLRAVKGIGMTEEQVNHFVDGCMSLTPPITTTGPS